ncbi:MAG: aldehyde dehydrogenase family protein [Bacteroidota bacterium]|jgi:acyl-CoA reductase-like NAD-dependent aldehyde dehydrogenase
MPNKKSTLKSESVVANKRLEVLKTYKIYIGGQFPRTESGRYYVAQNQKGKKLANVCLSSRKDVRDAVESARNAFGGWSSRAAFNRGQILYRMAEMLEGRKEQFIQELTEMDATRIQAEKEVHLSIDSLIYYAGWADKYQQVFSSVNPVASSHFNFSTPEPMGVVGIIAPQQTSLIGMVSLIASVIAGGNTCVVIGSYPKPLCAVTLAEVLHASDLPGGVVNILTGNPAELTSWLAGHMDVNSIVFCEKDDVLTKVIQEKSALNVKRVQLYQSVNWFEDSSRSPYFIYDFQEIKTTWHPVDLTAGGGNKY